MQAETDYIFKMNSPKMELNCVESRYASSITLPNHVDLVHQFKWSDEFPWSHISGKLDETLTESYVSIW